MDDSGRTGNILIVSQFVKWRPGTYFFLTVKDLKRGLFTYIPISKNYFKLSKKKSRQKMAGGLRLLAGFFFTHGKEGVGRVEIRFFFV